MSPPSSWSLRARRTCLAVATLSLLLAIALTLGWKGLLCEWGPVRFSVRAPRNPLLLSVVSTLIAWSFAPAGRRARTLADDGRSLWRRLRQPMRAIAGRVETTAERGAGVIAAVVATVVIAVAFHEGALVAGGSDSYGYVSQAHLWATGKLRVEPPLIDELSRVLPRRALAPLGYILSDDGASLVPTYPPGLPMTMALFERLGGRRAVFWVVPLLGGVAVWAAYLLGRRVAGPWCGALAAVLLASSPAFLFQLTCAPMSDLAAAAWWTLALAVLFSGTNVAALGSGVVAGIAILTRPNLVPLAIVPGAYLLWEAVEEWRSRRSSPVSAGASSSPRLAARRLLWFVLGVVPGCLAVAAVNTHLYGSPLESGYDVEGLFALEHALPNLARYPVLATEMHTPLIWLGLITPIVFAWRSRRAAFAPPGRSVAWVALWFVVAVFGCYLFYPGFDGHTRLRFLVPAIPPLLVLTSAGVIALANRLWSNRSIPLAIVVVAMAAWHGVTYARARGAFDTEGDWKYPIVGEYIARELPETAVLFAMQHSGSVRYYSGRGMVRYDQIPEGSLDRVVARLRRLGYRSYFVLEGWEEERVPRALPEA